MTYRDKVFLAATALARGEDANWELARLTFENTYERGRPSAQPDRVSMESWCDDVKARSGRRFSAGTGQRFKAVWRRYGHYESSDQPSWADAWESTAVDRELPAPPSPMDAPPYKALADQITAASDESKRFAFRRLAQEQAVLAEATEIGSPVSRAVSELEHKAGLIRQQQREQMVQSDPIGRRLEQGQAATDLWALCVRYARESERFAEQVVELLRRSGPLSDDRVYFMRQTTDRTRALCDQLDRYFVSGQTDLDAFLASVLSGDRDG